LTLPTSSPPLPYTTLFRSEPDGAEDDERRTAIARHLAELSARLGPNQELLSVDSEAADLADALARMQAGLGLPWTQFVELEGNRSEEHTSELQSRENLVCR